MTGQQRSTDKGRGATVDATTSRRQRLFAVMLLAGICLALGAVPALGASGRTFYVAPTGSDSAAGSIDRPWRTLNASVAKLQPGDTLYVRGGTYVENVQRTFQVGSSTARITWAGYPGERVVVKGQHNFVRPSFWTIANMAFTRNGVSTDDTIKVHGGAGWILDGLHIYDNRQGSGILIGKSSVHGAPRDWVLRNSAIWDTVTSNAYVNPSRENVNGLIEHNVFWNATGDTSSNVKLGWGGENVAAGYNGVMLGAANITFRYNTLYGAVQPLTIAEPTDGEIDVYRNLIVKGTRSASPRMLVRLDGVEGHLGGRIAVHDNLAWDGTTFMAELENAGPVRLADADDGGNVFPRDPRFDHTSGSSGFRPQDPTAAEYGRWAGVSPALAAVAAGHERPSIMTPGPVDLPSPVGAGRYAQPAGRPGSRRRRPD